MVYLDNDCTKLKQKIILLLDGELCANEQNCIAAHLSQCPKCLDELKQHEAIKYALQCNCKDKSTNVFFEMYIKNLVANQIKTA